MDLHSLSEPNRVRVKHVSLDLTLDFEAHQVRCDDMIGDKIGRFGWRTEGATYGQFFTTLHMPEASADNCRAYSDLLRLTTSPTNALALLRVFFEEEGQVLVGRSIGRLGLGESGGSGQEVGDSVLGPGRRPPRTASGRRR